MHMSRASVIYQTHPPPHHFLPQTYTLVNCWCKLQALVYDILPSTTAVFSYTIGSRKLSANEQFFVGAQTVVSLLQTTQLLSDVCFITDHLTYASSNKTKIVWIETELFLLPGVDAPHVYVRAWVLRCFHCLISTQTFRRALTAPVDSCAETKSNQIWQSLEEGAGKRCSECLRACVYVRVRSIVHANNLIIVPDMSALLLLSN